MKRKDSRLDEVPSPRPMPVVSQVWAQRLDLSNFINAFYQYRDLQGIPQCKTVLIIGPGQGFATQVLKWRGYEVTTLDIDPAFGPDEVGSAHDLRRFRDGQFDAVVASHVLEHLPVAYLGQALAEISRVGDYALIYLPVNGVYAQLRLTSNFRAFDYSLLLTISKWFDRPELTTPRYMSGQHYWEVGLKGFSVRDLIRRMEAHFVLLGTYRNKDWLPSQNFVLRSRRGPVIRAHEC